MDKNLTIAKFGAVHGILGWIRLFSYTEKKENVFNYSPWLIINNNFTTKIFLENWKISNKKILVKIKNYNNCSIARKLTNHNININSQSLPKLQKNEFYWKDIIRCTVFSNNFQKLGIIIDLISTPSNDVLVIQKFNKHYKSKKNILIPFIYPKIIKNVNINTCNKYFPGNVQYYQKLRNHKKSISKRFNRDKCFKS